MSWFYTCFCGAEQGEGGGTCSRQAGGRQHGGLCKVRAAWGQGPGSTGCRHQGPGSLGCRVLAAQGAGLCVPASPPSALLAGGICRRGSQVIPHNAAGKGDFWSRMSIRKRRVGGTCHAGHEGVVAMVGGRHAWCRSGDHVTPLFSTCLWRGYLAS